MNNNESSSKKFEEFNPTKFPGIIEIAHDLYIKKEESKNPLFNYLSYLGYELNTSSENPIPPEEERTNWFFTFPNNILENKPKCISCKSILPKTKILHNGKCPHCQNLLYIEFANGSQIEFYFVDEPKRPQQNLLIHSYDEDNDELRFYRKIEDCKNPIFSRWEYKAARLKESYANLEEILTISHELKEKTIDEIPVIAVPYKTQGPLKKGSINPCEFNGQRENYLMVQLFKGIEFSFEDNFPYPQTLTVIKAWNWPLLNPSPDLYKEIMHAARQVSRKDYYHQDGRAAFDNTQIDWMLTFMENFTSLDMKIIEKHIYRDLSGPGFIDNLARLTGNTDNISTEPNLGNTLTFLGKVLDGKPVCRNEFDTALTGRYFSENNSALDEVISPEVTNEIFDNAQEYFYGKKVNPLFGNEKSNKRKR